MKIKKSLNRWFAGRKQKGDVPDPAGPVGTPALSAAAETLEPEIVAVIAAVIAIEVKIFMALQGQRFTFHAGNQPHGWSEWGRMLIHPYEGVRYHE